MSEMFKVYDGVPIPRVNRAPKSGRRRYPIATMDVGQMFFVSGRKNRTVIAYISRIPRSIPAEFVTRRCWMVERDGKMVEVAEGTPGAQEGTGVWRTK